MTRGFFQEEDRGKKSISFDEECAIALSNAIRQKKRRSSPIALSQWSSHFSKLRTLDAIPKEQISQVLQWYIGHMGEDYVPLANSAKSFREKYPAIAKAMDRDPSTIQLQVVKISPLAELVHKELRGLPWPPGVKKLLPCLIQQTIDNHQTFLAKLKGLRPPLEAQSRFTDKKTGKEMIRHVPLLSFVNHVIIKMGSPGGFANWWWETIQQGLQRNPGWNGNIKDYVFQVNHPRFQWQGLIWSNSYCCREDLWEELMEAIKS